MIKYLLCGFLILGSCHFLGSLVHSNPDIASGVILMTGLGCYLLGTFLEALNAHLYIDSLTRRIKFYIDHSSTYHGLSRRLLKILK